VFTRTSLPAAQQDAADPLQTCCSPADPRASLLGLAGFLNLPATDLATAAPLVLAFSEFDDSPEAWARYDQISFLNPDPNPNPNPNPSPSPNPNPNPN